MPNDEPRRCTSVSTDCCSATRRRRSWLASPTHHAELYASWDLSFGHGLGHVSFVLCSLACKSARLYAFGIDTGISYNHANIVVYSIVASLE